MAQQTLLQAIDAGIWWNLIDIIWWYFECQHNCSTWCKAIHAAVRRLVDVLNELLYVHFMISVVPLCHHKGLAKSVGLSMHTGILPSKLLVVILLLQYEKLSFWESFTPTKANSKLTKDPINLHQRRCIFCASISPLSSFNDAGGPARPWAAAEGAARWVASSTPPEQVFHWNGSHFKNIQKWYTADMNLIRNWEGIRKLMKAATKYQSLPDLPHDLSNAPPVTLVPSIGWSNVMTSAPLVLWDA